MKIAARSALSDSGGEKLTSLQRRCAALGLAVATVLAACSGDSGHGPVSISDASPDKGSGNDNPDAGGSGGSGGGESASDARSDTSSLGDASQESSTSDARNDTSLTDSIGSADSTSERVDSPDVNSDAGADSNRFDVAADLSIDAPTGDARGNDAPGNGNADGGVDVSIDTLSPPDVGGSADAGKDTVGWGTCDPFTPSAICAQCETDNCPRDPTGCNTASGCTVQPACDDYTSPADQAACKAVLSCIRLSGCINLGNVNCFCGPGVDINTCTASLSGAQGVCKDEIVAGFAPLTKSKEIIDALVDVKYPSGGALALGQCDFAACGSSALGQGFDECIPFCRSAPEGGTGGGADANGNDGSGHTDGANDAAQD